MKLLRAGIALFTIVCVGLTTVQNSRAAHATEHLQALSVQVSNRLVTASDADKPALTRAAKALARASKTPATDLNLLATAARALAVLTNDASLVAAQNDALNAYFADARTEFEDALDTLASRTNAVSKSVSNKVAAAEAALIAAEDDTNGIPSQARLLSRAVKKISGLTAAVGPGAPARAPDSLIGFDLVLTENAAHAPTRFWTWCRYEEGQSEPFLLEYKSDEPEEVGRWTYERTGEKTGVIHLIVDFAVPPYERVNHDLIVTFTRSNGGTFTGHDISGRPLSGSFVMYRSHRP